MPRTTKKRAAMPTPEQQIEMYRRMCLIRAFDESAREQYKQGKVRGSTHMYSGEEAIAVGACFALRRDDYITSTHRGHGHCLAKGGDPQAMMAELLGKATGYCHGKGGSMHIADLDLGILGANGIVGGGIAMATGAAYSARYRGTDQVVVCFFGDGALNQGIFFESANMAALWQLPVIYLCEENKYAEFSPNAVFFPIPDLTLRAAPFGFPGVKVDGNDVLEVFQAVSTAAARARAGEGPTLIIADTYRLEGHHTGDPLSLRPKGERDEWLKRDPIARLRKQLVKQGALTDADADAIAAESERAVQDAVAFALNSPEPELESLWTDVLAL